MGNDHGNRKQPEILARLRLVTAVTSVGVTEVSGYLPTLLIIMV